MRISTRSMLGKIGWQSDRRCMQTRPNTTFTQHFTSGNHWAVESEIFWKARGDHLQFAEAAVACVFKKLYEATARWYDAGTKAGA